jgi:5-methylcytosine-specific restriction endonuclease McrA
MPTPSEKACRRCQAVLPLTDFYPRRNRSGYTSICKACDKARVKEWRARGGSVNAREASRRYDRTERGKAKRAEYQRSEVRKQQMATYRATAAGREATRRANQSPRGKERTTRYFQTEMVPLTMDHVVPLSKGGPHTKENVVPACRPCNARKKDRLLDGTFDPSGT